MTTLQQMRRVGLVTVAGAALALSACGGSSDDGASTTSAGATGAGTTSTTSASQASTSGGAGTTSATPADASTPAGTTSQPGSGTTSQPAAGTTSMAPSTTTATGGSGVTRVDPKAYAGPVAGDYRFVSPSGNLYCGKTANIVGCQSHDLVANLPKCNNPDTAQAFIAVGPNGTERRCTNEGVFIEQSPKVLPYGSWLVMGDYSCVSEKSGISCTYTRTVKGEQDELGFHASRQGFEFAG
ncbi:MAG: hypothetical protein LWW86_03225 [Micrococcales bacterium]|nr:hypothetical protein [Micrococcales bacterium]